MPKHRDSRRSATGTHRASAQHAAGARRDGPGWRLSRGDRVLVGMIHVGALPGTPFSASRGAHGGGVGAIAKRAAEEAAVLARSGFDAVLMENMHDAPYVAGRQDPAVVSAMTACGLAVQEALERHRTGGRAVPMGVQVLAAGNAEALAVALATGGAFVRVENFVFAQVADEGVMGRAEAGPLLRYRRAIGAEHVAVWADIKKKHAAHALTADVSLAEAAAGAGFFGADALIVTGRATGQPTDLGELAEARRASDESGDRLPVVVGSGVTARTVGPLLEVAEAVIIGSFIKREGHWRNAIDPRRAAAVVKAGKTPAGGA